jgi:hypothetical protein
MFRIMAVEVADGLAASSARWVRLPVRVVTQAMKIVIWRRSEPCMKVGDAIMVHLSALN